jgi:DNA-binding CsgD family transcriptional regulator
MHDDAAGPMLDARDTRAVVRLLGEVARLDGDLNGKRYALMQRLAELVDADKWFWGRCSFDTPGEMPIALDTVIGGFSAEELAVYAEESQDPDRPLPEMEDVVPLLKSRQRWTRRRDQVVADDRWHDPENLARHQRMNWGDLLWHHRPCRREGDYSLVALYRDWGRDGFTDRDVTIVHLLCSEVDWLHFGHPADDQTPRVGALSPRLRTVLTLMLAGFDRPMVARELGLSTHTVSDYTKQLYNHFNVRSQLGLIRRFYANDLTV